MKPHTTHNGAGSLGATAAAAAPEAAAAATTADMVAAAAAARLRPTKDDGPSKPTPEEAHRQDADGLERAEAAASANLKELQRQRCLTIAVAARRKMMRIMKPFLDVLGLVSA